MNKIYPGKFDKQQDKNNVNSDTRSRTVVSAA